MGNHKNKTNSELIAEIERLEKLNNNLKVKIREELLEEVKESEEKYRLISEKITDVIWLMDLTGKSTYVSPSIEKFTGFTVDEYLNQNIQTRFEENSAKYAQKIFQEELSKYTNSSLQLKDYHKKIELEYISKEGKTKWGELIITPYFDKINRLIGIHGVTRDVTERKESEKALLESEGKFKSLMHQSPFVVELYDLKGLQIEVNKAYEELWGFPASTTVNIFNIRESKEVVETGLIDYVNRAYAGESVKVPEYEFDPTGETESRGYGRKRYLNTSLYPIKNSKDEVSNIVVVHQDVTERKEAENELHESLQRELVLADIVRNAPLAIAFGYPDGKLENCNKAFSDLTGYSEKELKTINWNEVLTPPKWNDTEAKELQKLSFDNDVIKYEKEYIHKTGKIIPIELVVTAKFDNDKNILHFIGFGSDITERKLTEEELKKHQDNLSEMVKERTAELEEKNLELKRLNDLFMGREFRIKELRDKVKELENKLKP